MTSREQSRYLRGCNKGRFMKSKNKLLVDKQREISLTEVSISYKIKKMIFIVILKINY